jgi:hypothetical protein
LVLEVGFNTIGVLTKGANQIQKMIKTRVVITVENFEKMPMPIILDVKTKSGKELKELCG